MERVSCCLGTTAGIRFTQGIGTYQIDWAKQANEGTVVAEGQALGGFGETAVHCQAALQRVKRVKCVVESFLFLNVISYHPEQLSGTVDDRLFSRRNKVRNTLHVAFK